MTQNREAGPLPRLTVLAGTGPLPGDIVAACETSGREVFVVAHKGITDPEVIGTAAHEWVHLGAIDRTIALMHERRTEEVVFAGPVKRPSLTSLRLDGRALKLMAGWRKKDDALGDDKLLSLLIVAGACALAFLWLEPVRPRRTAWPVPSGGSRTLPPLTSQAPPPGRPRC